MPHVEARPRWSTQQAWAWYGRQPWLCGTNYLPRTAVNWVAMWQRSTFDPPTIAQELGWARDLGLNSLRIVLPYVVWEADGPGILRRLDTFLELASSHGLSTMVSLLDDCAFSGEPARLGPQPPPVAGLHNSRAVASPGREIVMDPSRWPGIEAYVEEVVSAHRSDQRVVAWDLYNEPGNRVIFEPNGARFYSEALEEHALELLEQVFRWARRAAPSQPVTTGGWHETLPLEPIDRMHRHPLDVRAFELSDVISFHAYSPAARMQAAIERLRRYQRPIVCTEWMGRHAESRIEQQLPLLRSAGVGSYMWGLVAGRTQTYLPWPAFLDMQGGRHDHDQEWFHDLLHGDGTPYSPSEARTIAAEVEAAQAAP